MNKSFLQMLLDALRAAGGSERQLSMAIQASAQRLRENPDHRRAFREAAMASLTGVRTTHALTEVGLLPDEGVFEGVSRRLGERLTPAPIRPDALEDLLREALGPADRAWLHRIQPDDVRVWFEAFESDDREATRAVDIASAIVILATRVAGAGMDARLSVRMPSLEAWGSPFLQLSREADNFAEALVRGAPDLARDDILNVIDRCQAQLSELRETKKQLGTTLRLSSASLRMVQQLNRLRLLVECTDAQQRASALGQLVIELARAACRPRPTWHFVREKFDLVAYLVIGHAAQKGEKYAAYTASEYRRFLFRSFLGGLLVAVFASLKLELSFDGLAPVPQALLYGANYAVCFVLIFVFGATLATKQPALTASRLADSLAAPSDASPSFAERVRAIWRSQFVSFLGNIFGAGSFAIAIAFALAEYQGHDLLTATEAQKLADKLHPWASGTMAYAAIAGVMLSLAGFVAGFVDNAMLFHAVGARVRTGRGLFRLVPGAWLREQLATRIENNFGAVFGNVLLGFMLGSAGAFGVILGIPFDIRHIAFGSSHAALAVFTAPDAFAASGIALLVLSVLGIGLINFLVSFTITLAVAITARRLEGVNWRGQLWSLWDLFRASPMAFFLPRS